MSGVQDSLEIKFRLIDGSDIGPKSFPAAASVATLKESILSQWPKEKENAPRTVKDIKIISAGKILENNKTVGECRNALCDVPGGITTMHVVVSQPSQEKDDDITFGPIRVGPNQRKESDKRPETEQMLVCYFMRSYSGDVCR